MSNNETTIESIFIMYRNQYYVNYQINNGVRHTIKREKAFKYFKGFVSQKNYILLLDLLSRYIPILIIIKEDKVIELEKDEYDFRGYRDLINDEFKNMSKNDLSNNDLSNNEIISNDNKLENIFKKVLK